MPLSHIKKFDGPASIAVPKAIVPPYGGFERQRREVVGYTIRDNLECGRSRCDAKLLCGPPERSRLRVNRKHFWAPIPPGITRIRRQHSVRKTRPHIPELIGIAASTAHHGSSDDHN